ncbi:13777_t:CDS:2 [Funneliformis caledonium]|uniref:13777_t:CDS:1 n=1 Tax=Funneliformis caledonium TaxID=1117310 RepID=A0A9N9FXD1_9GLOM|nr:13777_t:CDS:2 [Funneliformis caledonium]
MRYQYIQNSFGEVVGKRGYFKSKIRVTMKLMKKQEVMNEAYITITGLEAYHPTQYSTSDEFLRGRVELAR